VNYKGIFIGIVLVLVGSGLSTIPIYGWLLSAIFGIMGIIIAIWAPAQKDELVRTFATSGAMDMILVKKDNTNVHDNKDGKTENINKESK
jgi:hypothetical protein